MGPVPPAGGVTVVLPPAPSAVLPPALAFVDPPFAVTMVLPLPPPPTLVAPPLPVAWSSLLDEHATSAPTDMKRPSEDVNRAFMDALPRQDA
jgi:hypothetical protein